MAIFRTFVNALGAGGGITNPTYAYADDTLYATSSPARNTQTYQYYYFPNITSANIPDLATINSVQIRFNTWATTYVASLAYTYISVQFNGVGVANQVVTNTTEAIQSFTISNVTLSDLRSASTSFVAGFEVTRNATNTAITGSLDFIDIYIDYTPLVPTTVQSSFSVNARFGGRFSVDSRIAGWFLANAYIKSYKAFQPNAFQSLAFQTDAKATAPFVQYRYALINSVVSNGATRYSNYVFANSTKLKTITKQINLESEWAYGLTKYKSLTIDSRIGPTIGEPFDLDAYIRQPTETRSFYLNAERSKVGEKRGIFVTSWYLRTRVDQTFGVNSYLVTWRQSRFAVDSYIKNWFSIDSVITSGSKFLIDAAVSNLVTKNVDAIIKKNISLVPVRPALPSTVPSPVAFFPLDDGATPTLRETVGGKNATVSSGANLTYQVSDGSVTGVQWTTGYASTPFFQPLTSEVSIEFFMKTTVNYAEVWNGRSFTNGTVNGQGVSVSIGSGWNGGQTYGTINFYLNTDNVYIGSRTVDRFNDGLLHYVVCVWSGSVGVPFSTNQLKVYVDGQQVSIIDDVLYNSVTAPAAGNQYGATFAGYTYGQYTGLLSNLGFYTNALTASQISSLYAYRKYTFAQISFPIDANKVSVSGAGNRFRTTTINAVIKSNIQNKTRLLAQIDYFRKAFELGWSYGRQFSIDSWVGSKGGGMFGFGIDAYILKLTPILFDDSGNVVPPTFTFSNPPRPNLRIYIGFRQPQLRNTDVYNTLYRRVARLEYYISVYEAIPESRRTTKQKTALAKDLDLLDEAMTKLRQAGDIPINWVDYTSKVLISECSFTQSARVGAGSFTVGLKGAFPEIKGGEEIRVEIDGFRVFGGYVTQIEQTYFFSTVPTPKTVLHGTDYNALFDRLTVYNLRSVLATYNLKGTHYGGYVQPIYYAKGTSDQEIILDVIERHMLIDLPADLDYSTWVDAVDTPAPATGWMLPESGSPWRAMMQSITTVTNGLFYIDPSKALHYHDRSRVTAPFAITDGAGGVSCKGLEITFDISEMKNDVTVWGTLARTVSGEIMNWREIDDGKSAQRYWKSRVDYANKVIKKYQTIGISNLTKNQKKIYYRYLEVLPYYKAQLQYAMLNPGFDAVAKYGRWQYPEFRSEIHSSSWVLKRARSVVNRYGQPITMAKASIYEPGLVAGQVVTLKSNEYGITVNLPIRSMTITFPVSIGAKNGSYYVIPKYDLLMGLDPETGWDIYDYLPYEGQNLGYKAR